MADSPHTCVDERHPDPRAVVLLDGDPAIRDSLTTLMALEDRTVVAYRTAAEFLGHLDDPIGCVICAAELPDRSGLDVYGVVHERWPDAAFALLVSRQDAALLAEARRRGVRDVFVKPLVDRSLLDFVGRISPTPSPTGIECPGHGEPGGGRT
jgi:FixJ family two-component response regulator